MSDHDPPLLLEANLDRQCENSWFKHLLIVFLSHNLSFKHNNALAVLTGLHKERHSPDPSMLAAYCCFRVVCRTVNRFNCLRKSAGTAQARREALRTECSPGFEVLLRELSPAAALFSARFH
jgi:hypothetical protein